MSDSATSATETTGARAIADALIEHGVDTVFGIPGIQLDPLYDAFYERRNQVRVVHTRHEQGAAFMAMGYAQSTGRAGVFAVVPGPGLLNAMAAVSTAVAANAPVLGITGQIPSYQIGEGLGMAHELRDQLAMSAGVVDWALRADRPDEVPALIGDAFRHIHQPRNRCAIFEMAPDALASAGTVVPGARAEPIRHAPPARDLVDRAAARLAKAGRPAIFVGGGALDASPELVALAERLEAPVVMSVNGGGAIPSDHPLALGMIAGQRLWADIDVAVAIGTRFTAPALAWGRGDEVDVIRIDADPVQIEKPGPAAFSIVASAADGIRALLDALGEGAPGRTGYLAHCAALKREAADALGALQPQAEFAKAMRAAMPRDAILAVDVTQMASFVRYGGFPIYEPRTLLAPGYQATLGFALPAALGAQVANPDRKVVAICGDGGFMFTVQELATAVHHRIPVVTVVFDNSSYGNVKTIQAKSYGARHIAVDLTNPDFAAMAETYGMAARTATTPAELQSALEELLALNAPGLIRVPIGEVPSIWSLVKRPPSQGKVQG